MNTIPAKYKGKLVSPFMLVHGEGHDQRTWFPLFSICYFHHVKDNDESRSENQAQSMDGIAVGRSATSNAMLVYNPRNKRFYEPETYKLDPYRLPCSMYPDIKYDGGLFCSLLRDENPHMEEKYPPGTRVERLNESTKVLQGGTVMDVPLTPAADAAKSVICGILSCLMMALQLPSLSRRWRSSFRSLRWNWKTMLMSRAFPPFFVRAVRSHTSMKVLMLKATLHRLMVSTVSVTKVIH